MSSPVRMLVLAAATPALLCAQGGRSAAVVLELPASARALGVGNAYGAFGMDESSIFYNPAQLAGMARAAAGGSVQRYLASSTLASLAAAMPIGGGHTFAIGIQSLDYGSEAERVTDPATGSGVPTGGTVSASDVVVSAAYAARAGRWRAGITGKYISQRIAGSGGSAGAIDAGAVFDAGHGITLAAAEQNVGGDITTLGTAAPLPRMTRLSVSAGLLRRERLTVAATAEFVFSRGSDSRAAVGAEATWAPPGAASVALRAGIATHASGSLASPVTLGGGIGGNHVGLDYAYQRFDTFGATHRIGARWFR